MFRFHAALSVSLGLARLLSVTTKYVLTLMMMMMIIRLFIVAARIKDDERPDSVFWVCQIYEKVDSSSQAD